MKRPELNRELYPEEKARILVAAVVSTIFGFVSTVLFGLLSGVEKAVNSPGGGSIVGVIIGFFLMERLPSRVRVPFLIMMACFGVLGWCIYYLIFS
ncbi:hypothetical protein A2619_01555 [candidate division WWE3 bacterium RIFOXYD1_FULL_39_9]|nr:MAG: hypothetical protein A2619_01555 [candidate division WWE3 bacterium RIFOXYD1_FULL_39_9]